MSKKLNHVSKGSLFETEIQAASIEEAISLLQKHIDGIKPEGEIKNVQLRAFGFVATGYHCIEPDTDKKVAFVKEARRVLDQVLSSAQNEA